jgi:hypothetical protein
MNKRIAHHDSLRGMMRVLVMALVKTGPDPKYRNMNKVKKTII